MGESVSGTEWPSTWTCFFLWIGMLSTDRISLFPEPSSLQALRNPILLHKSIFHDWTDRYLGFEEFRNHWKNPKGLLKGVDYLCPSLGNKAKTWSSRNLVSSVLEPLMAPFMTESHFLKSSFGKCGEYFVINTSWLARWNYLAGCFCIQAECNPSEWWFYSFGGAGRRM